MHHPQCCPKRGRLAGRPAARAAPMRHRAAITAAAAAPPRAASLLARPIDTVNPHSAAGVPAVPSRTGTGTGTDTGRGTGTGTGAGAGTGKSRSRSNA